MLGPLILIIKQDADVPYDTLLARLSRIERTG